MGRTSSITMPSMMGILGRAPAVDKKVWCFFCLSVCFLSRFGMTKFVITETLWSSIILKTIIVSLHRGRFVVVHLCSSLPIDPQNFSRGANFYQKLPHIFKAIVVKFGMSLQSSGSLPQAIYCKNGLRGYTPLGAIYTKIPILAILGAVLPHFLTDSDTIWHEDANLGRPPQAKFGKNR